MGSIKQRRCKRGRKAVQIMLNEEERKILLSWVNAGKTEQRFVERAKIILKAGEGESTKEIAKEIKTRTARVSKWRNRFAKERMQGLSDSFRSGRSCLYSEEMEKRVIRKIDELPPEGYTTWTGTLLADALGDVSADYVWKVLRKHGIQLQRKRRWCVSTDPQFSEKAADIVGLYLDPPENAMVLCVDEKPNIQALERAQGWLKLPNGKALTGFNHEYKRHGTTTLFASLEVVTGLVKAGHYNRKRRKEFLHFMNQIITDYQDKEVHVILDNLSTHKPKHDMWLRRHPNVYFHYTPTHASWLNQIECWFSILTRRILKVSSFTSPMQVREAIDKFIKAFNKTASPFEWTKRIVYPVGFKKYYANL